MVSYSFVVIFLLNAMGYFMVFMAMQQELKTRARTAKTLHPDQVIAIVVEKDALKQIQWVEEGEEMLFNHQRYDIVKVVEGKDATTFYCLADQAETALYAELENHVKSDTGTNHPFKSRSLKKFLQKDLKLFFPTEKLVTVVYFIEKLLPIHGIAVLYHPPQMAPPFPPPKPSWL